LISENAKDLGISNAEMLVKRKKRTMRKTESWNAEAGGGIALVDEG
jgi:hypothetical protein